MICDQCDNIICEIREQRDYYEGILFLDYEYMKWIKERLEKQGIKVSIKGFNIMVDDCCREDKRVKITKELNTAKI